MLKAVFHDVVGAQKEGGIFNNISQKFLLSQ
jgi:hypothetical protein